MCLRKFAEGDGHLIRFAFLVRPNDSSVKLSVDEAGQIVLKRVKGLRHGGFARRVGGLSAMF